VSGSKVDNGSAQDTEVELTGPGPSSSRICGCAPPSATPSRDLGVLTSDPAGRLRPLGRPNYQTHHWGALELEAAILPILSTSWGKAADDPNMLLDSRPGERPSPIPTSGGMPLCESASSSTWTPLSIRTAEPVAAWPFSSGVERFTPNPSASRTKAVRRSWRRTSAPRPSSWLPIGGPSIGSSCERIALRWCAVALRQARHFVTPCMRFASAAGVAIASSVTSAERRIRHMNSRAKV
jgi:hypothetical protein